MRCLSGVRRVGCVRRQRSSVAATHAGQTARDCELEFSDPSPAENVERANFCNKIGPFETCRMSEFEGKAETYARNEFLSA
jgi:hypothetical protein